MRYVLLDPGTGEKLETSGRGYSEQLWCAVAAAVLWSYDLEKHYVVAEDMGDGCYRYL